MNNPEGTSRELKLSTARSRLADIIEHMDRSITRLYCYANAVYGPEPPTAEDPSKAPPRSGAVGALEDTIDRLQILSVLLDGAVQRLE